MLFSELGNKLLLLFHIVVIGVKAINIGKEEIKLSLFTDDITVWVEIPKNICIFKNLLHIISELSKFAGHQEHVQTQLNFCTLAKIVENKNHL